ncbi:hydrogenase nickel incorporation protein HypB [Ferrimonas senticii]|uniref:hydrogenase nickel incorporation protein HypB n=1 Tax=Ferrimonas senticii TaxID=394566 RepID=UPI0004807A8F|nr:hydrogenase nickel incorporation protein HypB [Ferrimonas senticii]
MCTVCGCAEGQTRIEGEHRHHHDHHHDDHGHHHHGQQPAEPVATVIHHHYHHSGDVHHHVHYHVLGAPPQHGHGHDHAHPHQHDHDHGHHHGDHDHHHHDHDHQHGHHHGHDHQHEHFEPEQQQQDLHYGKGPAHAHAPGMSQQRMIQIEQDILGKNNEIAAHNRSHFIDDQVLVLNLVSSPGSGKTTTLTETLLRLKETTELAVIEGDQETANDAERIRATGVNAIQVNTGKGCHLDAAMVHQAYHHLSLKPGGILFIENVGNLVCPAAFDLGEHAKVAILSVTEGEDKPLKYPEMFAAAELMLVNKIDLLPYLQFDLEQCIANARKVNPNIEVICLSATSGEGMELWLDWLQRKAAK